MSAPFLLNERRSEGRPALGPIYNSFREGRGEGGRHAILFHPVPRDALWGADRASRFDREEGKEREKEYRRSRYLPSSQSGLEFGRASFAASREERKEEKRKRSSSRYRSRLTPEGFAIFSYRERGGGKYASGSLPVRRIEWSVIQGKEERESRRASPTSSVDLVLFSALQKREGSCSLAISLSLPGDSRG